MEPEKIGRQVRLFKKAGLGGGFLHARTGLLTQYLSEEWFKACRAAVDQVRVLMWAEAMRAFIGQTYDSYFHDLGSHYSETIVAEFTDEPCALLHYRVARAVTIFFSNPKCIREQPQQRKNI